MNILVIPGWAFSGKPLAELLDATTITPTPENCKKLIAKGDCSQVIVGWSMGGLMALEALSHSPSMAGKLVLLSSTACFCRTVDYPCGLPEKMLAAMIAQMQVNPTEVLRGFYERAYYPSTGNIPATHHQEATDFGLQYLARTDVRLALPTITLPTLIIHGARDRIIPLNAAKYLAEHLPNSKLEIIENGGHTLHLSHAADIKQLIDRFVNDNTD